MVGRLQPSAKVCELKKDSHGKGDRVLRAEELPETVEVGSSVAVRKGHRVLLADKEISLAGTGFQTDSGECK